MEIPSIFNYQEANVQMSKLVRLTTKPLIGINKSFSIVLNIQTRHWKAIPEKQPNYDTQIPS